MHLVDEMESGLYTRCGRAGLVVKKAGGQLCFRIVEAMVKVDLSIVAR